MKSLDEILAGDGEAEEVVVEQPVTEAELPVVEAETRPRDENGRFAPKGVEEGAPPAPPTDKLPPEEYKALRAEREKRQAIEQELAQIRQQLSAVQNPPQPPPPPISVFEDEQGFGSQIVSQAVSQASLNAKLDMSEMMMRQATPDFEEMKQVFLSLMAENPALQQQALADPHPWNKAVQIARTHKTMQDIGATDLDTLKAKLREEIQAEMTAQMPATGRPVLPATLSNERNVGQRSGPAWAGPTPLDSILG
jgi:hypothetical protein